MNPAERRRPLLSTDPVTVLAALQELKVLPIAGLHDVVSALAAARRGSLGLGSTSGRPADELPVHALVVLAAVRLLLDQLGTQRWEWVRDALDLDVPLGDVAHILRLDIVEVRAGVQSWAWRLHSAGEMDDAGRAHVHVLGLIHEIGDAP